MSPGFVSGLLNWRWSPALAIGLCPVAFVVLAVAIIPDEFGRPGALGPGASRSVAASSRSLGPDDSQPSSSFESSSGRLDPSVPVAPARNAVRGIFHSTSPEELPVEPPDPDPEPPPPPPPPPPTATIFTLPEPPPPVSPESAAVDPAPVGEATPPSD